MQYRLVALFAMTVTAVPVILTGGDNGDSTGVQNAKREKDGLIADYTKLAEDYANLEKRADEDISNLGVSANALSNGDSTVKNAKRTDDISVGPVEAGIPVVDVENVVKRTEDIDIGSIEIRR